MSENVWHLLINPFSGSEPLCGNYFTSPHCATMEVANVNCPDCLAQMNSPRARASQAQTAALEAQAEREWRRNDPASARLYDELSKNRRTK